MGILNNTATLGNVLNLETGKIQALTSNIVTTNVLAVPEIDISQTFNCSDSTIDLSAILNNHTS